MSWKYVIVQVGNFEVPVIFPSRLVHAMVADAVRDLFVMEAKMLMPPGLVTGKSLGELRRSIKAVSAGECDILCRGASGSSESLNLNARPDDQVRINTNPYTGGVL